MKTTWMLGVLGGVVLAGLVACGGEDSEGDGGQSGAAGTGGGTATGGTGATAGSSGEAGSAGSAGQTLASQNSAVSECGGFEPPNREPTDYCAAEKLLWAYDSTTRVLSLANLRVLLNCCGEHSFEVFLDAASGVYHALETDAPEMHDGQGARCNCMCVFDFKTEVPVNATTIDIVLRRHVTDEGDAADVWAGTLDLSAGSGEVVLDDEPLEYGCAEY